MVSARVDARRARLLWACNRALADAAASYPDHPKLREESVKRAAYEAARCSAEPSTDCVATSLAGCEVPLSAPDAAAAAAQFGGRRDLIVQSTEPVLSRDECAAAIDAAEAYARASGGWSASRHVAYATVDIPLHAAGGSLLEWFNQLMRTRLLPLVASAAGFRPLLDDLGGASALRVHDAFLVKYECGDGDGDCDGDGDGDGDGGPQQSELRPHQDQSLCVI